MRRMPALSSEMYRRRPLLVSAEAPKSILLGDKCQAAEDLYGFIRESTADDSTDR